MFRSTSVLKFCIFTALWFGMAHGGILNAANVTGTIDGVFGTPGAQYIQGWACEPGNANALYVDVYTGGGVGTGQIYGRVLANAPSDPGVQSACGTTTGHRFYINTTGDMFLRGGQAIYMYGIAQSGGPNNLLSNSGDFLVPNGTTVSNLDNISLTGVASGWAFDSADSSASLNINIYIDGNRLEGAETGTLLATTTANELRSDVNSAYHITGNHGFSVQLPQSAIEGLHTISVYPVDVGGGLGSPLNGSPGVPGGTNVTSQFSYTSTLGDGNGSGTGFPTSWQAYVVPAGANLVSLAGTVSVNNSANIYSEMLFLVWNLPAGACSSGFSLTQIGPSGGTTVWRDMVKAPTAGVFTTPVNFTLPVGIPMSECMVVGINGGTPATAHNVTGTVNLTATYIVYPENAQPTPYGIGWEVGNMSNGQTAAAVQLISEASTLNTIWGNISDSTFDSAYGGDIPTGTWTATNDVYVYPASSCASQFTSQNPVTGFGWYPPSPSVNYYNQIPQGAVHLLSVPLSANGGPTPAETINYLLPGYTNGAAVYQTFSNVTVSARECLVSLFGYQGSVNSEIDSENQLTAVLTPN